MRYITEINMSERKLTRHEARELAFKILFAKDFDAQADAKEFYRSFIENTEEKTNDYVEATVVGVSEKLGGIDALVESSSNNWKLSRMSTATRTVLRLSVYELTETETPPKVVINEAVEIIKLYDEDSAPSFVNGILNNIARERGLIA